MAVQPIHTPRFRAFDANGNPLSGGLLYSYAAGTTTPQSTYTTRAGDVANANPVVLNANGEASVWCTPNVTYKFVLKDSGGVTQWTEDNVPALPDLSLIPLQLGDGTVSEPALGFISDPDSGLYRIGSGIVGMASNGVEAQRWMPGGSGNIVLADSNPASTTAFESTLTPTSIIKAWARITTTGGGDTGATIVAGFNVTSAVVATTALSLTFASPFASTVFAAFATLDTGGTSPNYKPMTRPVSTTKVDISFVNAAGSNVDIQADSTRTVNIFVLGAQ